jgi:hypothetical protein
MIYSLLNKYEKPIDEHLKVLLKPLVYLNKQIAKIKLSTSNGDIESIALTHYWLQIDMYLKYANGGIGYDMFISNRFLGQMLGYSWILSHANIQETDHEICKTEIKLNFYILLNCIYNIKEKWHKFLNFDKRAKKTIVVSVLNENGQTAINKKLDSLYRDISNACSARDCLVHDISSLYFDQAHNMVKIGKSNFTLSDDNIWKNNKPRTCYQTSLDDILETFIKLETHRKVILQDLSNPELVDCFKLKRKYINSKVNAFEFGLT